MFKNKLFITRSNRICLIICTICVNCLFLFLTSGNINILLMGDSSVAKSQMLGYIDRFAPRSTSSIYYYRTCRLLIQVKSSQFLFKLTQNNYN